MQRTLAALNVTSGTTHEVTLAPLYRKLQLREKDDFSYITGYNIPQGWKYVQYVTGVRYCVHLSD